MPQVKETKFIMLMNNYENILDDDLRDNPRDIYQIHWHSETSVQINRKELQKEELISKVRHSLTSDWNSMVTAIENFHDLSKTELKNFISNLITHETRF